MNYRQAFSAPATGGETKTKHGSPDTGGEIKNLLAVLHPPQLIPRTASTPPQQGECKVDLLGVQRGTGRTSKTRPR